MQFYDVVVISTDDAPRVDVQITQSAAFILKGLSDEEKELFPKRASELAVPKAIAGMTCRS